MTTHLEQAYRLANIPVTRYLTNAGYDIGSIVIKDEETKKVQVFSSVNQANLDGYTPIASTFSGSYRILRNLVGIIGNLALLILCQKNPLQAVRDITNNIIMIARGAVEMVPLAGNLIMFTIDKIRIAIIESQLKKEARNEFWHRETKKEYLNGCSDQFLIHKLNIRD